MTTAASAYIERKVLQPQEAERRFYTRMAIFMSVLVFAGFSSSFYLRGLVHFPRPNPTMTPLVYLHGAVFTCWMVLFVVQVRLVSAGRRDLHMKLGAATMVLALAMLPIMFYTAAGQVARANQPPFTTPLAWSALPFFTIPVFALFIALAWRYRRQAQVHKRFMLLAALMMMEPAVGRLPLMPPSLTGQYIMAFIAYLTIVPLFVWDWRSLGRLHWATIFGAVTIGGTLIARSLVWQTDGWARFAGKLVTLAG